MSKYEVADEQKPLGHFDTRPYHMFYSREAAIGHGEHRNENHLGEMSRLRESETDKTDLENTTMSVSSEKLSQDTGYGSSSMLISDVSLPQLNFNCDEFEQIVSRTPPRSPQQHQSHQQDFDSPTQETYGISSEHPSLVPVKKRKPRKQSHEHLRPEPHNECEFVEVAYPVTPDCVQKREKTPTMKARRSLNDFEMSDVCAPYDVLCTANTAPQNMTNHGHGQDTDTQAHFGDLCYPGFAPSQRTPKKIEARRLNIRDKISKGGRELQFTVEEEFDIHGRAEAYVMSIMPNTSFYQPPCLGESEDKENINTSASMHSMNKNYYRPQYMMSPYKRRRRRNYSSVPCLFVKRKATSDLRLEPYDNSHVLPEGTKLLKPPNKLVELVAQTLDESPDGLLQVQQVYTALMNKYPYFRFMDRTSINSWRSSIRHALYQKWFRKVKFNNDLINCKGCFWAINRKFTPREWTMPGQLMSPTKTTVTRRLPMTARRGDPDMPMDENASAVQSILNNDENDATMDTKYYEGYQGSEYPYHEMYRRCSDPVLANSSGVPYEQQPSQEPEVIKIETQELTHPVSTWEQHIESANNMYLGTWTPSWEEYHQSLAFQPPLMASNFYVPQPYMENAHYTEAMPYYYHHGEHPGYPYAEHW